jgi:hypothetical protein
MKTKRAPRVTSRPQPFGYKCAWLAIKGTTIAKVRAALPVIRSKQATWQDGIAAVYEFDLTRRRVFVSPEVNGWTFVVSPLGLPAESVACDLTVRLSAELKTTAQFFATHRVVELHVWVLATSGKLVRAFGYLGESGAVLFDRGKPTDAERSLGVTKLKTPNEQTVMSIAAAWSIDPTSLADVDGGQGQGLLGEIGS